MTGNWKTVLAVIGGSVVVLLLVTFGLSKLQTGTEKPVTGTEGQSRLVLGNKDGKVTITEFSDFQCPACAAAQSTVDKLLAEQKEIKLVYRQMPLTDLHPNANPAALAAEAANVQGKFVEYHDWLFRNRGWVDQKDPTAVFVEAAGELGLDKTKFEADLKGKTYQKLIDADVEAANSFGVNATPTFYVNGIRTSITDLEQRVKIALGK